MKLYAEDPNSVFSIMNFSTHCGFLVSIEADIGICPSWGTWRRGRDTPCWGVRAGGRSTKNIYLDISHMPNYSFLAPIEAEIGICPS